MDVYNISIVRTLMLQSISIEGGAVLSATPSKLIVTRENTQTISLTGLYDSDAQAYGNSTAVVQAVMLDEFGNTVVTVPLSYDPGTQGNYSGDFGDASFLPPVGRSYTIVLSGTFNGKAFKVPVLAEVISSPYFSGVIAGGVTPSTPSPVKEIYQGNTQEIDVTGLQDADTGAYLNAATLTATLYDPTNIPVPGCINIPMPYVPASNGNYVGTFGDNTFMPALGTGYTLIITGSQASTFIELVYAAEVVIRSA